MTDANEGRPLTRRQLRELERAAELAQTGGTPPVPDEEAQRRLSDEPAREGRHSTPSVPAAEAELLEAIDTAPEAPAAAAEPAAEPVVEEPPAPKPAGRFFGRRGRAAEPAAPAAPVEETVAIDAVELESASDDTPAAGVEVIEAELQPERSVPAPSSARRSSVPIDDVQGLDTVDDLEIDSLEIDEVQVAGPRVSALRVAESTPAQLEDRRAAEAEPAEEPTPTGPSRGQSQRLPVIVNVVPDTSEHHIADLREQGVAGSGGSSTGAFTANALVLPAGADAPEFALEGDDGVLVTGSIDVPEGFATSGRGRATIDGNDVDGEVADGEVASSENAPVRASRAVSSYANARVQIAPTKRSTNAWPIAIGVGAGAFVAAVGGFLALALTQGWL
ncbi:hypothetical protein OVA14_12465 [Agrococcus sp. SL85]|uniref:hypothetical protein n=1 Tax=Agrococcus sp. SL85 TaxID=2995141 RepID=UPI00226CBAF5|nr:hypothetical protein [Agrococcus sp. SL85]WAC66082.1 hypothetical protein OVA14_12465 [Agrococcus sp. SL85]